MIEALSVGRRVEVAITGSSKFVGGADAAGKRILAYDDPLEALADAAAFVTAALEALRFKPPLRSNYGSLERPDESH